MLASKYKIRDRRVFEWLKQKGKRVFNDKFVFVYLKDENLENVKFGIIVTKKVSKKAVVRNRIRRIIYSALENYCKETKSKFYGLFIVRKDISEMKSTELEADVKKIFRVL